ncbi:cell division protein FtsQ/DivIB [Leptolyngbya sp. FACHB-261]|uniref:cell division protein FtsQ/DivIB n=1 Tax=Leptolyngbya sp. FACHB-261 TaxID=2692806 RepID=UPI0016844AE0|nr:FtsQ-type POTRA domain-containing protein [Leptolyngbya sp. FACHB-261]MBD2101304.1 FtsQ-type POTRA domain-containing protein [Leptolyngbya sp. FACHB-261]
MVVYLSTPSQEELLSRRRELRRRRRRRLLETSWRTLMLGSLTGGLIWVTTLPIWMLDSPEQVVVEGNEVLSDQAIQSLLPLSYPQSLIRLQPQDLAQHLESVAPIQSATVARRLFPPGLAVTVEERRPVAVATQGSETGFLDDSGAWMSMITYPALKAVAAPPLRVIGLDDSLRSSWPELYQQVQQSPVPITEINWQDENNLILKTSLATIHCGPYNPDQFQAQLTALDRMRALPTYLNAADITYIDLRNPRAPAITMNRSVANKSTATTGDQAEVDPSAEEAEAPEPATSATER